MQSIGLIPKVQELGVGLRLDNKRKKVMQKSKFYWLIRPRENCRYSVAVHGKSIQNQFIVKLYLKLIPTFNGFANKCYIIEYADIIYIHYIKQYHCYVLYA